MNTNKLIIGFSVRHLVACLGLITGIIFYYVHLFAQAAPCPTCTYYSCSFLGASVNHSGGIAVYDDGYSNYVHSDNGGDYCRRKFLFAEYTGSTSKITLTFTFDGTQVYAFIPFS